ncbi:MAG: inositol monophosphatase family protein, partial [Anaerolineae bacterium]|nr:inositol monophosphatase family protein [Anaerolineae bacterium]
AWAVDPIDGTKGFIRGDQFAIAIGLIVDGEAVVSALACPLLSLDVDNPAGSVGIVATAARGQGATIEPLDGGNPRPLYVSMEDYPPRVRVVESVESGHTDHSFTAAVLGRAGVGGAPLRMDSQAKYAAVADGRAEIYIRTVTNEARHEKIWDHAGGVLLVEEAGGRVTDLDGKPVDFSCGAELAANRGILATNGLIHETLLGALRG